MKRNVARFFVRPAERETATSSPRPDAGASILIVVVCAGSGAQSLGAAVALLAARARRAPAALVATWTGDDLASPIALVGPPLSGARRLAADLVLRGLDAQPAGRVVHLSLPPAECDAAVLAERAISAARAVPTVLVVGGPRGSAFDALLADSELAVVMTAPGSEPLIAELACGAISLPAPAVVACAPALGIAGRTLALAGVCVLPSLRAALHPVAGALR